MTSFAAGSVPVSGMTWAGLHVCVALCARAVLPETVVPYYPYFSFVQASYQIIAGREHLKLLDQAVTVPSPATNAISEACKESRVVASIGVNERDGGTLYNTQLLFDADGALIQRRRKTTPTYHERMVWGQGVLTTTA
jgi:nitrilase